MKSFKTCLFVLMSLTLSCLLSSCACDDDSETDDDTQTSGDDTTADDTATDDATDDSADDDTDHPVLSRIDPIRWGRYTCPDDIAGTSVIAGNYNIYGGNWASAERVAEALVEVGPFDFLGLQECPDDLYAQTIADALSMDVFYANSLALLSKTPLSDLTDRPYTVSHRHLLHGTAEIDGVSFSVYAVHIGWNNGGYDEAAELVEDVLLLDPSERIILMGDWNEELGSRQFIPLDTFLADGWSSLGVHPSARTSWPSGQFYGSEGQQLIDNVFFNKSSGACGAEGGIYNLSPSPSDHKPEKVRLVFPATAAPRGPILRDVVYGLGPDAVGLLFDKPLASVQAALRNDLGDLTVSDAEIIGDQTMVLVRAEEVLPTNVDLTAAVTQAEDVDGNALFGSDEINFGFPPNLLIGGDAEDGAAAWELDGMESRDGWANIVPLQGTRMFSGVTGRMRGWATQTIDLSDYKRLIDDRKASFVFSGASCTGFGFDGEGPANLLRPHDEGEAMIDFFDADGRVLSHHTSGHIDTMYWQPWRLSEKIPPGVRRARVTLRALAVENSISKNTASFDALFFSVTAQETPHEILAGNLIVDPLFENRETLWNVSPNVFVGRDHWLMNPFVWDQDVQSYTGEFWMCALLLLPGSGYAWQDIDLLLYRDRIQNGELSLDWGAAIRSFWAEAYATLSLTFLDAAGNAISTETIGPDPAPEYFIHGLTTKVPEDTFRVVFRWEADAEILGTMGAFLSWPFVYPVIAVD